MSSSKFCASRFKLGPSDIQHCHHCYPRQCQCIAPTGELAQPVCGQVPQQLQQLCEVTVQHQSQHRHAKVRSFGTKMDNMIRTVSYLPQSSLVGCQLPQSPLVGCCGHWLDVSCHSRHWSHVMCHSRHWSDVSWHRRQWLDVVAIG